MHSIGIDVSDFNCMMSRAKLADHNMPELERAAENLVSGATSFSNRDFDDSHDKMLKQKLGEFNEKHFPVPEFKEKIRKGKIADDGDYGKKKLAQFLSENKALFEETRTRAVRVKTARALS